MMDLSALYRSVLARHRPSDREYARIRLKADVFMQSLQKSLDRQGAKARVILGGSVAKGTMLKGSFDCDVFVAFGKIYREADNSLPDILENALKGEKGLMRVHGSRDYFRLEKDGINYEIIPVLDVGSAQDALNVTDMSPLHVAWIGKELKKKPRLRDEIRLAKLFCKSVGVYGAESYICGFSGHVLDILVAYYGSFTGLLQNARSWQRYKIIDIMGHGSPDDLNRSKISPLIVIDPVDRNRNAAAALSMESFRAFRKRAAEFLESPEESFFTERSWTPEELIGRYAGRNLVMIRAESLPGKPDIAGTRLKKLFEHLLRSLEIGGFTVQDSGWRWDRKKDALFWFVTKEEKLPGTALRAGPPARARQHAAQFRKKHPAAFEKAGRLHALVKREHTQAGPLLRSVIRSGYAKERAKRLRVISAGDAG